MGFTSFMYNTFMKTNVRYALTIVTGAVVFEQVYNKVTTHIFRHGINRGRSFEYYEKELMMRKAQEDDDE